MIKIEIYNEQKHDREIDQKNLFQSTLIEVHYS